MFIIPSKQQKIVYMYSNSMFCVTDPIYSLSNVVNPTKISPKSRNGWYPMAGFTFRLPALNAATAVPANAREAVTLLGACRHKIWGCGMPPSKNHGWPSGDQTWQWTNSRANGSVNGKTNYIWWMFHCHVWLPEGTQVPKWISSIRWKFGQTMSISGPKFEILEARTRKFTSKKRSLSWQKVKQPQKMKISKWTGYDQKAMGMTE